MPARHPPSPIVGRDRERQRLRQILDAAIAGHGSLVLISGEAGIGKTTLVEELIEEARQRDCLVLSGGCYDLTTTPPYGPWVESIRAYQDRETFPAWPLTGTSASKTTSKADLFDEMQRFFHDIAADRPLLIVLEDLHWADQASIELVRHTGRSLDDARMVIIATYRDPEISPGHPLFKLLPLVISESRAVRLELNPLGIDALEDLLQATHPLPASERSHLAQALQERTAGNPLFVREVLRLMERQGILRHSDSGWEFAGQTSTDVPQLIIQLLENRLADVSHQTRAAVELAAVIGQEISIDLWESMVEPGSDILSIIREATDAQIVVDSADGQSMQFRHALVRQALYDGLLLPQRRSMHQRVAETLLATGRPDPGAVAHHLEQSGDPRAADWLIRAGGMAERLYAPLEALRLYERALDALEQFPERDRERGWLMHRVARLYRWHAPDQSLPYLRMTMDIARQIGDRTLEAYVQFDSGLIQRFLGDIPDSLDQMVAGVRMIDALPIEERERSASTISPLFAEAIPDTMQSGYAAVTMPGTVPGVNLRKPTLSWLLAGCGRFDEAEDMATSVIRELHEAAIEQDRILALAADAFRALGVVHAVRGRPEEAAYHLQATREAATAKGDHQWAAIGALLELLLVNLVYETETTNHRRDLERLVQQQLGTTHAVRPWLERPSPDEFQILFINGDWRGARELANRYLDRSPPRAPLAEQGRAMSILAGLAHRQGRLDESKQWIARLFPHGPSSLPDTPLFFVHERTQRIAVEVALDGGNLESAACWLDAHEAWLDGVGCVIGRPETSLLRARLALLSGDIEGARTQAWAARDRANDPRQPAALLAIARFLGELELGQGNIEKARDHAACSLALAERCELPHELALSRLAHAEVLAASGDPQAARTILSHVLPVLKELEAQPDVERAETLSRRISAAMNRRHYPDGLSPREAEILAAVARGLTNAEIADELFISSRTVGSHVTSIYRKLGVRSRAAATRFAFESGLTPSGDDTTTT